MKKRLWFSSRDFGTYQMCVKALFNPLKCQEKNASENVVC